MSHSELAAEQHYVDEAYSRLESMRQAARKVAAGYAEVRRGGTHQARLERDAAQELTRRRLAALDIGDAPLCFGRLDLDPDPDGDAAPPLYVGRIAVTADDQAPLVVDWRAPVAEPFYRATGVEPMGVARRRHFLTRVGNGREIVSIDDEVFDRGAVQSEGLTVLGEGALLEALERARTGRMGDIVATIQSEQDEAIRAPLPGVLVVAGGAGTGKTAVALHRAAYLLYTHRRRLAAQGVLLVGPNTIFLRYIDQVLPSLGEDEVVLTTPAGLKPRYRPTGVDDPAAARLKGDARMAEVLARALRDRERGLPRDLVTTLDNHVLRLRRATTRRIVERARSKRGTHNARRPQVVRAVVDHLRDQYRRAMGAAPDDADWDRELDGRIGRLPEVRAALERMWPVLTGAELVHDLFSFPALIRSAARGVLADGDHARLFRPRSPTVAEVAWTEADLALIDEADHLLGSKADARPRRRARRRSRDDDAATRVVAELGVGGFVTAAELSRRYEADRDPGVSDPDEPPSFGHVVVDEAQDLSAMQWRVLARRCPSGSMTIVGDFGQATAPGALRGWDEVLRVLGSRVAPRVVALSVNYRTPAEIMDLAQRVLVSAVPDAEFTRAVRTTGSYPRFWPVDPDQLVAAAADAAAGTGAGRAAAEPEGTVAVIAPPELHDAIVRRLGAGARAGSAEVLDARVAVLGPLQAKGLEFDRVVVVEPAALVTSDAVGLRLLYVALTRATRELVIVHAQPLPEALTDLGQPEVPPGREELKGLTPVDLEVGP